MIRITIEEIQYELATRSDQGDYTVHQTTAFRPMVTGDREIREQSRVLLLQEMDDLRIAPIVVLLNDLDEADLCTCGHFDTLHEGNRGPCSARKGSGLSCSCHAYETAAQKELATERDKLQHAAKEYGKLEGRVQVQTRDAERRDRQIATLTRSRDRLLSQKGKRR